MRRREFLATSTGVLGANDRIRIGVIGAGGRGQYLTGFLRQVAGVEIAAVKAVRASGRIVQVGVQRRSCPSFHEAKSKYIDSGRIGKITAVRCTWDGNGWFRRGVPGGSAEKPADLNWERFRGPAPTRPWDALRYYNWGAYRDYSTGQPGGVFSHLVDVAHWFTGDDKPLHAVASGGVFWLRDGRDVPDTLSVIYEYGKGHAVTAHATLASRNTSRTEFFGTGGTLLMRHRIYSFTPIDSKAAVEEAPVVPQPMEPPHILNWIECLRSRKQPNADVSTGHFTAVACHMGNRANERKTTVYWNKEWNL